MFYMDSDPQCWENMRLKFEGCEDRSWLTSWLFPCKAFLCVQRALLKDVKRIGREGCGDCNMPVLAEGNQSTEHLAAVEVESPSVVSWMGLLSFSFQPDHLLLQDLQLLKC